MRYTRLDSPIGSILLAGKDERLAFIGLPEGKGHIVPAADWSEDDAAFATAKCQLLEYFAGERKTFELALAPSGTPFQLAVLQALQGIAYGETKSYQQLAEALGRPKAVRAVGAANGRNPLPIVIPCHRVIGKDGSLTGFGGGLAAKAYLLELEGALLL